VTDFLARLDLSIFRALNDFCGWNPALDRIVVHLEVLKGSIFMGIVGVLWYWPDKEMPRWGLFFGIFAAFAALARVFLGIHYPSDIVVGALIGIATSVVVNREAIRQRLAAPVLAWEVSHPPYFYGLFFLALAEMSGGFPNTRRIGVAIVHLFVGYPK
jgi:hypothetical protein